MKLKAFWSKNSGSFYFEILEKVFYLSFLQSEAFEAIKKLSTMAIFWNREKTSLWKNIWNAKLSKADIKYGSFNLEVIGGKNVKSYWNP